MQFPWAQTFVPSPLGVRVPASLYSEKSLWGKEPRDGGGVGCQGRSLCPLSTHPSELSR